MDQIGCCNMSALFAGTEKLENNATKTTCGKWDYCPPLDVPNFPVGFINKISFHKNHS